MRQKFEGGEGAVTTDNFDVFFLFLFQFFGKLSANHKFLSLKILLIFSGWIRGKRSFFKVHKKNEIELKTKNCLKVS